MAGIEYDTFWLKNNYVVLFKEDVGILNFLNFVFLSKQLPSNRYY